MSGRDFDRDYDNELTAKELLHSLGGPLPPGEVARSAKAATDAFFGFNKEPPKPTPPKE